MRALVQMKGGSPLYRIMRQHARLLPLVVLLGLAAAVLEGFGVGILVPLLSVFLGEAMPGGMPGPIREIAAFSNQWSQGSRIAVLGLIIVALFVGKALVQLANLAFQARLIERLTHAIRCALAAKLLKVGYGFTLSQDSARFINILYLDIWNLGRWIRSTLSLAASASALLVITALLFWLEWRLTLLAGVCGAVLLIAFSWFVRRLRSYSADAKATGLAMDARLEILLYFQRTIRLFGQEERERRRFEARSADYRASSERIMFVRSSALPVVEIALAALFIAIIFVGYRLNVPIASIAAYLVLLSRAQPHIRALGDARLNTAEITASAKEVNWLLAIEEPDALSRAAGDEPPDFSQSIRFEAVTYVYPNEGTGICDAGFTLRPGIATALIGPSGSGKTTIVNLLTRLLEPESGAILLGDRPIGDFPLGEWRSRIAVAGQDAELVDATVAENIAYGRPDASREEIELAARVADAERFIADLPDGYATRVGRGGLSLSGGQRQRIGLARALVMRPDLLILDEATNAVDGLSERAIMDLLASHSHFRTALVISHRESTLANCEDAVVLDGGRVVRTGPMAASELPRTALGSIG
jgi:subfamily B ATP-binding cassette protein MsbA